MTKVKTSLADKLAAAGLVSATKADDLHRAEATQLADVKKSGLDDARASGTIAGITEHYVTRTPSFSSIAEVIDWAASWYDELVRNGHEKALRDRRIERCASRGAVATEVEIVRTEKSLGFALSPSVRDFYRTIGGVGWSAELRTLTLGEMLDARGTLLECLTNEKQLAPYHGHVLVAPLCAAESDFHFLLANERLASGEMPIYFVYHDDSGLLGGYLGMLAWLAHTLDAQMTAFADL